MIFVAAHSLRGGIYVGFIACAGVALGTIVHTLFVIAGFGLIIQTHPPLFLAIKFLGACYLFFLGVNMFLSKAESINLNEVLVLSKINILKQGLITNLLNPKVALFFMAFLPQFVSHDSQNFTLHIVALAVIFEVMGTAVNMLVCYFVGTLNRALIRNRVFKAWQNKVTGSIFMLLAFSIGVEMLLAYLE
jgi:threonine/homoserine/homoserine lactone efflux protein